MEIECACINRRGVAQKNAVWYSVAGSQIRIASQVPNGNPFTLLKNNRRVTVLVIPNFGVALNGTYTCAFGNINPDNNMMKTIDCK